MSQDLSPPTVSEQPTNTSAKVIVPENVESADNSPDPVPAVNNNHQMVTRSKNNIRKPNTKFALSVTLDDIEPTTHTHAMKDERWRGAMGTEFDSIVRNQTFTLFDPRLASNVIGCKWILCHQTLT